MSGRVDLRVEDFDALVISKGSKVKWQEAMFCYCLNDTTGQPNYNCPVCRGTGFYYGSPIDTIVLISSITGRQDSNSNLGLIEKGTANITTKSTDLMGFNDRLEFTDFNSKYSQLIKFDEEGSTQFFHKKIKRVIRLISSSMPVTGWKLGEHFEVSEDGWKLNWIDANTKPSASTAFSVVYVTSPTYLIDDVMHELRGTKVLFNHPEETFHELPKQFSIRREDFAYVWR